MNTHKTTPPPSGFGIHDALYIVFKHKWKIITLSIIGLSVSGFMAFQIIHEPSFQSKAKLMVRYVVERSTIDPEAANQMMNGGMSTELEILTSRDTALAVAQTLGPEVLIPDSKNRPTIAEAATKILHSLEVENPMGSPNMLYLKYRDSNPKLAPEVLNQIILTYFSKHLELHRNTDAFSQVSKQTDEARSKLRLTEEEINQLKNRSGVLTIEATIREFESRRRTIKEAQLTAESGLAEQIAKVESLKNTPRPNGPTTSAEANNNQPNHANHQSETALPEDVEALRKNSLDLAEFHNLARRLPALEQRRNQQLIHRKPTDPMITSLDRQINEIETKRMDLIEQHPHFANENAEGNQSNRTAQPILSLKEEMALESAFKAKLASVQAQAKSLESEVTRISALGFQLQDLERRRQLEEDKYRYFQTSLEKARLDETLDPSKIPNISVIQSPSPPMKSIDDKALKMIIGIAFVGLVGGLAIAFLIEMVIDRRVSRPLEIVNRLQLPLMISIPHIQGKYLKNTSSPKQTNRPIGGTERFDLTNHSNSHVSPSTTEQLIKPFTATIHDQMVCNFQANQTKHKPKLIALTGLSHGAGTSTIAAGLAKNFSEHFGTKVLLVNLSENTPDTNPNGSGTLLSAIEESQPGTFDSKTSGLYYASATTRIHSSVHQAFAPADLHHLLPKLMTSEFDYIIFDMPPVNRTSPTLAMVGFMDQVLLILDGSNTTKEYLCWAYSALVKTRTEVSCIFNKAKKHAPRWIEETC
jgi:uncharacterized protein involved in exopolysaccharide biosynthesis/Mrp family chromosome partitioning ATPase